MPYVSPATVVTGTTITTPWGNSVKAATDFLANPPACRVYHNTTQALGDGAILALAFNSERYDTDAMHNTASLTSRITFNTAGIYVVQGCWAVADAIDYSSLFIGIRLNGTAYIGVLARPGHNDPGLNTMPMSVGATYKFAVADYVELVAWQNNTANVARNVLSTGNYTPEFAATWIGTG